MAITIRDILDLKEEMIEKFRILDEKIKKLEASQKLLKIIVLYNAITNTVIALLLWQLVNILSAVHGNTSHTVAQQGVQQGQQIAVVKTG